jgi:hypothetical protein
MPHPPFGAIAPKGFLHFSIHPDAALKETLFHLFEHSLTLLSETLN